MSSVTTTAPFAGVRQSRLGVRSSTPTDLGDLKTIFEFELFGTGVDSGQTTFRLRHAWGELGAFGAGQYLEPIHRPGRVSELARVLGPDRSRVVPERPAPLDADQQRQQFVHGRTRAAGRQRRRRRVRGSRRAAEHQTALPGARSLGGVQGQAEMGLRAGRRPTARNQVGRRARRSVRLVRQCDRLGHQSHVEPQHRQERRPARWLSSSARGSRTR